MTINKQIDDVKELEVFIKTDKTLSNEVREKLVENIENYKRLISKMARKYVRHRVEYEDLVQEAMFGLMLACRDFNPERSTDFHTYAIYRMKGKMYEYCIGNESPIYVPTQVAKAASYVKQIQRLLDREPIFFGKSTTVREIIKNHTHPEEESLSAPVRESLNELKRKLGNIAINSKMNYDSLAALAMESLSLVVSDAILTKYPEEIDLIDELVSTKETNNQLRDALGEKRYTVLSMRKLGWNLREIAEHLASIGYTNRKGERVSRQAIKAIINETIQMVEKMKMFRDLHSLFDGLKKQDLVEE